MGEKTILMFQPAILSESNRFAVNGIEVKEPIECKKYFKELQDSFPQKYYAIPYIKYYKFNVILYGKLYNKDEKGRTMAFLYLFKGYSKQEFNKQLFCDLELFGLTISEDSVKMISHFFLKMNIFLISVSFITMIIILFLIYIIFN